MKLALARVRLFPAVAGAAAALLLLKTAELAFSPSDKVSFGQGFTQVRVNSARDPETTGSTPAKKEEKKDEKPAEPPKPPSAATQALQTDRAMPSPSEKALLERLGERREVLDERQRELDTRENLLKAADKKLEARINELKELENRNKEAGGGAGPDAPPQAGLKTLVTMYETMKPKDAARVFDKLDLAVLLPVVNGMNPRKMAEILAAMSPDAAGKLTVELATRGRAPAQAPAPPPLPAGELQAIEPRRP